MYNIHTQSMKFEWDEKKRLSNIQKHGIDFRDIAANFENFVWIKDIERTGGIRQIWIGDIQQKIILTVSTRRNDKIRIISARMASKKERELWS